MKKITKENLNVLRPNVVKNDLLYIASVLSYIDEVVSQTYGPLSGYVASIKGAANQDTREITYTKDGYRTLSNMSFNSLIDIDILNMVRKLADKIKKASGDGSTTAAKVLYGMIKNAAEYILNNEDSFSTRINAPKATEIILSELKKSINNRKHTVSNTQDILDCAFIALNNDESLMGPFREICEDINNKGIDIKEGVEIGVFRSLGEKTTVDKNPGFNLGAYSFIGRPIDYTVKNTKLVLFTNNFSMDYNNFILKTLITDAQTIGEQTGIHTLYMVAGMDNTSKRELSKVMKSFEESNKTLYCNFVEVPYIYDASNYKREDLCYFAQVDEININDFVEKRDKIVDTAVDTKDNDLIVKWRVAIDNKGELVDPLKGYRDYQDTLAKQFEKGILCNVKYTHGMGLTITPSDDVAHDNTSYKKHIDKLKEIVQTSKEEDLVRVAKERLLYMKKNYYTIYVGRRVSDEDRLFDAYNDAGRAITAMIINGYHMGASVGALYILDDIEKGIKAKLDEADNPMNDIDSMQIPVLESAKKIVDLMIDSFMEIIPLLYYQDVDTKTAFKKGIINSKEMTVNNRRVIAPINTDSEIISTVLLQFAHLFSSLMFELDHPDDVFIIKNSTEDILKNINGDTTPRYSYPSGGNKGNSNEAKVVIEDITPAYSIDKEIPIPTKKEEEPVVVNTPKRVEEKVEDKKVTISESSPLEKKAVQTNSPRFSVASGETRSSNEEFEKMKALIDKDIQKHVSINKADKAIIDSFEKESGKTVKESVDKFNKSMEEYYSATEKEVKIDDKTGVGVEIEYPKGITQEDLEKIKKGAFNEL